MVSGKFRRVNKLFVLLFIFPVFFVAILLFDRFSPGEGVAGFSPVFIDPSLLNSLKDGDLVFRRGRDLLAGIVLAQGDSARFSHVGMVLKNGDEFFVVHSVPGEYGGDGGVKIEELTTFASSDNAVDLGFYRVDGVRDSLRQGLRSYVLGQLGKPFDSEFRFSDDSEIYCTELVLKAYKAAGLNLYKFAEGIDIPTLSEAVFLPDDLRRSSAVLNINF